MSWKKLLVVLVAGCGIAVALAAVAQTQSPANGQKQGDKPASTTPGGKPAPPPPLVTVEPAVENDVSSKHTFVGTVMPKRESSVGSAVDARVTDFPVNEGDRVEAGDMLAQLLKGQLEIQLAGAKADTELAQRELDELKASWPLEVDQAQSRLNSRKAALDFANSRLQRTKTLFARNTVTADQLEEATSLADQAAQAYAEAKAALAITEGPRKEAIAQAESRLMVKREAANAIQDQIDKHTIKAPFSGYVVEEFTEVGQWVAKAGLVCKVVELDEVDVEIMVLESLVPHLEVGVPATVEIAALGKSYQGQVAMIVPQADPRSRNFPVKVRVKNTFLPASGLQAQAATAASQDARATRVGDRYADSTSFRDANSGGARRASLGPPEIKAGMFARVRLEVALTPHAMLVHKDAVVLGGKKPVVYVVDGVSHSATGPGRVGTVRQVEVDLGVEAGSHIAVSGSIRPGDLVVVQGNERLRPQMPVTVGVQRKPEITE
jgi:multidrug efflux pump subunit AcrA (membrane-fusion protein)